MIVTGRRLLPLLLITPATPGRASQLAAWPARPTRILTPSPPGSSVDAVARLLADGFGRRCGGTWFVENRVGAEGVVAAQAFVRSPPGSALLFSASGIYTAAPLMFSPLPYDTKTELVPIGAPVTDFIGFFAPRNAPTTTLSSFFTHAREKPSQLTWAAAGAFLLLNAYFRSSGLQINYVGYPSLTGILSDVAAGRLDLAYLPLAPSLPLVQDGQLRLLAVSNPERAPAAIDTPTVRELGFPDLEFESFPTLFGWREMPAQLRQEVAAHMHGIISEPPVSERLRSLGMVPRPSTTASFEADLRRTESMYAEAARRYGVRPSE